MADLLDVIKQAGMDAVGAASPVSVLFGQVVSASPLEINVEQKMTLGENFLILADAVREHQTEMTLHGDTEGSGNHSHGLGRYNVTVHCGLRVLEKVLLLQVQGGQKFVVLDRV